VKRLVLSAVLAALIAACGPDNPFGPDNPSPTALTGIARDTTTVKLSWTKCPDSDFASNTIYRSANPGIKNNIGSATVLAVINENTTITLLDKNLESGAVWYYTVKTANESAAVSWSNEVYVKLPE
jgi:hypothetical protein